MEDKNKNELKANKKKESSSSNKKASNTKKTTIVKKTITVKKNSSVNKDKKNDIKELKNSVVKNSIENQNEKKEESKEVFLDDKKILTSNANNNVKDNFLMKKVGLFPIFVYAIVAVCIIFIVFILLIISISCLNGKDKIPKYSVVYTNDDKEVYAAGKSAKSNKVDSSFTSDSYVYYPNDDTSIFLYLTDDTLFKVKTKNGDKDKIATDVDEVMFSDDDKYIVYLTNEGDLYSSNFKKIKLAKNVDQIYAVINNKVYFGKNDNLYVIDIKGKKESMKIDSDIFGFTVNENNKIALYRKYENASYDIYMYNFNSNKTKKIAENVSSIINVSDDYKELIYLEESHSTNYSLKKILKDDLANEDEEYIEKYESSARDSMSESELADYHLVKARNEIRDYVDKEKYEVQGYNVYYVKNGKKKLLAAGVSEVLSSDIDTMSVSYIKSSLDTSKKLSISDYRYLSSFKVDVKSLLKSKLYYKKINGKEVTVASKFDDASVGILSNNKFVYVLKDGSKYSLYSGKVFGKKLKSEVISADVKGLDLVEYNDGVAYFADYNSNHRIADLYYVTDSFKPKKVATDVYTGNVSVRDDNLYYYLNYENNNGDLYRYNGSRSKLLLEDVTKVYYLRDNYMYVLNDCDKKFACDLNIYTGHKKIKKVASDVTGIISNNKIS